MSVNITHTQTQTQADRRIEKYILYFMLNSNNNKKNIIQTYLS